MTEDSKNPLLRPMFVTRRFPPSVGGQETLAVDVWNALETQFTGSLLVAHGGSNRRLPLFFARAWWQILRSVLRRRCDLVITGDAPTFVVLWPLLALLRVPAVTMVLGLDLSWSHPLYRFAVRTAVPRARRVIAISNATAAVARGLGVPPERCAVVTPAVADPHVTPGDRNVARRTLHGRLALPGEAVVLVTLGRLVARKGVRWFITEVMSSLPPSVHYVVAGSGPERRHIEHAVAVAGLGTRVHLVGRVGDGEREELMRGSDLFVQPNIPVDGDMEGFGLVAVEAACRGTPVVASALEGLREAVIDLETGILVPPADAAVWCATISRLIADRAALCQMGQQFRRRAVELNGPGPFAAELVAELLRAGT